MADQYTTGTYLPTKIKHTDEHDMIDISDTGSLPDYDDAWEVDSDTAFNLEEAVELASKTGMHVDLPYLPAANPPGCPHVLDLSQERVIDAMRNGECALSRADLLATILYNYDEELLKAFVDVDGYSYVRLKINEWQELPWTTVANDKRLKVVWRDKVWYMQDPLSSTLIIRVLDHVYVSASSMAAA